jgi:hypothetical protein
MKALKKREKPLSQREMKFLQKGALIRLCYDGGESFWVKLENGTSGKVDDTNPPQDHSVKCGDLIRFKSENVLSIL